MIFQNIDSLCSEGEKGENMKKILLAVGIAWVLCSGLAVAEENKIMAPDPNETVQFMEAMLLKMMEVYSSPKIADAQAKFYKNLYEALLKQGFTKQEAMQIVISQGPLCSSSNK